MTASSMSGTKLTLLIAVGVCLGICLAGAIWYGSSVLLARQAAAALEQAAEDAHTRQQAEERQRQRQAEQQAHEARRKAQEDARRRAEFDQQRLLEERRRAASQQQQQARLQAQRRERRMIKDYLAGLEQDCAAAHERNRLQPNRENTVAADQICQHFEAERARILSQAPSR